MTRTQVGNLLYAVVCVVAVVGAETGFLNIVPDSWKHYVTTAAFVAMWLKSHRNLWLNPDGSPAAVAYDGKVIGK